MIENNYFEGQTFKIDGMVYRRNQFKNCVLIYGGGPINFSENTLVDVKWEFTDSAARTISLLSSFYRQGGDGKNLVELLLNSFGKNPDVQSSPE